MGANEKHDATYHGGEYVPTPDEARATWVLAMAYSKSRIEPLMQSFDRMIAKVRAEAKAEAYKDAERILHEEARWQLDLHQRHKEYRFKHCSERMTEMENCMTVRANQYKENQS